MNLRALAVAFAWSSLLVSGCKAYDSGLLKPRQTAPGTDGGGARDGGSGHDGGGSGGSGGSGGDGAVDACVSVPEICNRLDDDCDGMVDEDAVTACQTVILNAESACVRVGASSSCVLVQCNVGFEDCDGNPANGCEPYCKCHDCTTDAGEEADGH